MESLSPDLQRRIVGIDANRLRGLALASRTLFAVHGELAVGYAQYRRRAEATAQEVMVELCGLNADDPVDLTRVDQDSWWCTANVRAVVAPVARDSVCHEVLVDIPFRFGPGRMMVELGPPTPFSATTMVIRPHRLIQGRGGLTVRYYDDTGRRRTVAVGYIAGVVAALRAVGVY